MTVSRLTIYFSYQFLRIAEITKATAPLISPATVVSNAIRSDSDSVFVSPCPSAISPGPSGISVPIRPNIGAMRAMTSVIFVSFS